MDDVEDKVFVFEGTKTIFPCHYKSAFEFRLMKRFELSGKVKGFYQPDVSALVQNHGIEQYIKFNFLIEYKNGNVDFVYIEDKDKCFVVGDKAQIFILNDFHRSSEFGIVIVNELTGDFRRIDKQRIKSKADLSSLEIFFVNFDYVN